MSFFDSPNQRVSRKKRFGLCDDAPPPHKPAFLDEADGKKWIAVVHNDYSYDVLFVALDNSIALRRPDGKPDRCSDGLLSCNSTVIFVELTTRKDKDWKKDKEEQLRITIRHFENTEEAHGYEIKKAYIANSSYPKDNTRNMIRMNNFFKDTKYVLRIENRIVVE
ncbi:MAG: hypothetical protein LBB79_01180 [Prevotellaceae bacterium]|jgi:hypothetical protein|nr:hypothetical protein [Prevotellaceae bacterium]